MRVGGNCYGQISTSAPGHLHVSSGPGDSDRNFEHGRYLRIHSMTSLLRPTRSILLGLRIKLLGPRSLQRKIPGRLRWTILLGHPTRPIHNSPEQLHCKVRHMVESCSDFLLGRSTIPLGYGPPITISGQDRSMAASWHPSRPFATCCCKPYLGMAASWHSSRPFVTCCCRPHDLCRPYRGVAAS